MTKLDEKHERNRELRLDAIRRWVEFIDRPRCGGHSRTDWSSPSYSPRASPASTPSTTDVSKRQATTAMKVSYARASDAGTNSPDEMRSQTTIAEGNTSTELSHA